MKITGGWWAWQFLRFNLAYVEDWWRWAVPAPEEPAPFPLRAQTEADLRAAEWGLFAWVDPSADDGAASAFWIEAPTFEAEPSPEGAVLLELLAMPEARLNGLRLADGSVIVKVGQGSTSVHLRIADGGRVRSRGQVCRAHSDAGIVELAVAAAPDGLSVADRSAGQAKDRRDEYGRELLAALKGKLAGKKAPDIAVDVLGVRDVKPEDARARWYTDGDLRMLVRRRIEKSEYLMESGFRVLARGR